MRRQLLQTLTTITALVALSACGGGSRLPADIDNDGPQNQPPVAVLTCQTLDQGGPDPVDARFDASQSYDPDGAIVRYDWLVWGNVDIELVDGPAELFVADCTGGAQVTVFDNDGLGDSATALVQDQGGEYDPLGPQWDILNFAWPFDIEALDPSDHDLPIGFEFIPHIIPNSETNAQLTQYNWDFGDGTAEHIAESTIRHGYTQYGKFIVELTVYDENGRSNTWTRPVTVL